MMTFKRSGSALRDGPKDESAENGSAENGRCAPNPRASNAAESTAHLKFPHKHKPVFVDAKAMKDKLRENMHKPRYDVANFYKDTGPAQHLARNSTFEHITLGIIAFNSCWIAIDADHNHEEMLMDAHPVFIIAENLFCTFFTFEILTRFCAFKHKTNCLRDAWFVFDSFMVGLMVFETWLLAVIVALAGGASGGGMGNASLLRLLRLLRLSRMARVARLLRSMPELLVLIKGMIAAIRSVFFTLLLLFLLLYIFAILCRQLTVDSDIGKKKFYSIPSSMQTLVLDGILFDGPGDLMEMIEEESLYILVVVYYLFVLFAALTVMNMLIGVLCEVVSATAACEREELTIVYVQERLKVIVDRCCNVNEEGELKIGKKEFLHILEDREATGLLTEAQVDVFGIVDLIDTLFTTETGQERICDFGDLIEVFMDQRTSNTATVKDITTLRKYVRGRLDLLESNTDNQMAAIGSMLETFGGLGKGTFDFELQRRNKAHGFALNTPDGQPVPPQQPASASSSKPQTVAAAAAQPQTTNPEEVPEEDVPEEETQPGLEDAGQADREAANQGDPDDAGTDEDQPATAGGVKKVMKRKKKLVKKATKAAPEAELVDNDVS